MEISVINPGEWDAVVRRPTAAGRALRDADGGDEFVERLLGDRWKVEGQVTATSRAARRDGVSRETLELKVEGPPGVVAVAVARHASGAITFVFPHARTRRATRAARGQPEELLFSVPAMAASPAGGRRGIVTKILKVVVTRLTEAVVDELAEWAFAKAARALEESLWTNSTRRTGWLRVSSAATDAEALHLEPAVPNFGNDQRGLLLVHGTFSDAAGAFKELARQGFLTKAAQIYGDRIFAFNHFTFSASLEENAHALLEALPNRPLQFDAVTHSRGGLLLRTLCEPNDRIAQLAHRFRLGRAVLGASPNEGTPLATPGRWAQTLGWFANLLELFPENPLTTCAGWVSGSLSWIAQHLVGDLPGLSAMDMQGSVISELQGDPGPPADAAYFAICANFAPDQNMLARFSDMGIDAFFAGANDLVVPTDGGWRTGATPASWVPVSRIGCFGAGGNILRDQASAANHLNIMGRPETASFILRALRGEDLGLPAINAIVPLPRRGLVIMGAQAQAPEPVVPAAADAAPQVKLAQAAIAQVAAAVVVGTGWNVEDALHLIVLPPHGSKDTDAPQAQLLATYRSACVLEPFRLSGPDDRAGERWRKIIAGHKTILKFVGGDDVKLEPADLEALGSEMFDTLFPNSVRRLYDQARFSHQRRRLNLVFTSMIPWVADLPWEFAYDASCRAFLASGDVRFVRNVLTAVPADQIEETRDPLSILVVSAQPPGTVPLSLDEERTLILRAFQPLIDQQLITVDALPKATPALLHAQVRAKRYDVVHFMGHGEYDKATGKGYLIFQDTPVPAESVQQILRSRGIRLIFLNACETGRGSSADYNAGVAPALVADGIPAVVANQYSVLDRSATTFAQHFYWCLAQGLSLGDAAREARISLGYTGGGTIDWAVPVLFARNPDAKLCSERAVSYEPPTISMASEVRAAPKKNVSTIAVWDVSDVVPDLETTLDRLNQAQDQFRFELVNLTAPYGTWKVASESGEAYLRAESVARRLRGVTENLGFDYVLCITDLRLGDRDFTDLYLWYGFDTEELSDSRVMIFSIAGFRPPLTTSQLPAAFANVAVAGLVAALAKKGKFKEKGIPKDSIFSFNRERSVAVLTGRQYIDDANREEVRKYVTKEQFDALEAMLEVFHANDSPVGTESITDDRAEAAEPSPDGAPKAGKKKKKKRRAPKTVRKPKTRVSAKRPR